MKKQMLKREVESWVYNLILVDRLSWMLRTQVDFWEFKSNY